ncbi:NADH dehydrogenase subunit G [Mycobacterium lentiflavum]|uniref:NADH-quinone oxidoreductase n=1 Tax=Mycobacterium lentiflavum TaxID=141349 RepID=A0A0E4H590_MYCLN|nr:NADH-quinone oxidoreductase subunit G [Mycobacterium lentiflavum]CQD22953.1 NADH dehydrogenase subunit G [Mycobacterium lentiflavum]
MTQTADTETTAAPQEMVTLTIDGVEVSVPTGTLVIRAAESIGIQIPRFCDHPLLDPVGACRQCLVEVEGQRKPMASCTITCTPDMVVRTQFTSEAADTAQQGVMELLLINHPLDCPVCDKGGECPLQNQAMSNGRAETQFHDVKRTFTKPIPISSQVLLDRERCVLCARCTRFSNQIAGDPFIDLLERGALQQVGVYAKEPFHSYFSGNTVQICPVGALTGTAYRFRARPFDLVSSPGVCEHCASGCAQRTDHRRGKVLRRLAGDDPEVNEEWNCDKGRWAFSYATQRDRITSPLIRAADGALVAASWSQALTAAARGLKSAHGRAGVLVGGRATWEDAYAYAKFARMALGTHDIDFRIRPHSEEEAEFLAARVAGRPVTVTYSDLEAASAVLLVGFEPEEESPIVFLRLRKAARTRGLRIYSIAPFTTGGLTKMAGTLLRTIPGAEPTVLDRLHAGEVADLLRQPGAVILVGERLAAVAGGLSAVARLADGTGARLAWVPRRAGERGALEAGALPSLLPGGRPTGRRRRGTAAILADAAEGMLGALLVGGAEIGDLPDPDAARHALTASFVVSLELRHSEVTDRADVVFPVASVAEKSGTFLNWEGRQRPFPAALTDAETQPDLRVLDAIAAEMGVVLALPDPAAARAELLRLGPWEGQRANTPSVAPAPLPKPAAGQAILAGHRMLLDNGRLQDGETHLAGTARAPVARLSESTAAEINAAAGDLVSISTGRGTITLPLALADLPHRVVWLPLNSPDSQVHQRLGVTVGAVVAIGPAA